MTKKKVVKKEYVDPRLAKATVILREMLNSFRPRPIKKGDTEVSPFI